MGTTTLRLLRRNEVEHLTGLARSSIYDLIRLGRFPAAVPLTAVARAWRSDEIENWIAERIAERDAQPASAERDTQVGAP